MSSHIEGCYSNVGLVAILRGSSLWFGYVWVHVSFISVGGQVSLGGRGILWFGGAARQRSLRIIKCFLGGREVTPSANRGQGDRAESM